MTYFISVAVLPGQMAMTASMNKGQGHVGDPLNLTCSGPVGTVTAANEFVMKLVLVLCSFVCSFVCCSVFAVSL